MINSANALPSLLTTVQGSTPEEEFKCYGLPIGALGFISDLLTAYTTWCLFYLRRPWWPFSEKSQHPLGFLGMMDLISGLIMLVGTVCLTIITMVRCQNHWQYLLLAIERLGISVAVSFISMSATLATRPDNDPHIHRAFSSAIWGYIMFFANILGTVGYFSLLVENWKNPEVRVAFGSTLGVSAVVVGALLFVACCCRDNDAQDMSVITIALHYFGIVASDWMLGAIAGNIPGIPDGKVKVLYWLYFPFKRLPMLWS
jgi:hypothetical protein